MPTEAQIAANRRNALKSTGPRTEAGKAATGRNALRHGLCTARTVIFEESAADFDDFAAGLRAALAPADEFEAALAERIVHIEWRLRRVWRMEAAAIDADAAASDRERTREAAAAALYADWAAKKTPAGHDAAAPETARQAMRNVVADWSDDELREVAAADASPAAALWPQKLGALARYEAALERQLHRATATLERRQARRLDAEPLERVPERKPAPAPRLAVLAAAPASPALPAPSPALAAPARAPIMKITKQSQFAAPPPRPNPLPANAWPG